MLLITILCLLILYLPLPETTARQLSALHAVGSVVLLTLLSLAGFWMVGRVGARRCRDGTDEDGGRSFRLFRLYRFMILGVTILDVFVLNWPLYITKLTRPGSWMAPVPVLDDLLIVLPLMAMILGAIVCQYRIDHARRHVSLRLGQYVMLRLRVEEAIIFVPWLFVVSVSDLLQLIWPDPAQNETANAVAGVLMLGCLFTFGPVLLTKLWKTVRLPDGPLRQRLERFCEAASFHYKDLRLWQTEKHIGNAAVTGLFPRWRYVILSDVLVEHCSADEITAILAHEIAHIKFHHLRFYMLFAVGYLFLYANLQDLAAWLAPGVFKPCTSLLNSNVGVGEGIMFVVLSIVYWGVFFGYVSRRMELQADLYSAFTTGTAAFVQALHQLALISGVPYGAWSWRHFSIGRRIELLGRAQEPEAMRQMSLKINLLKYACVMLLLASGLRLVFFRPELFA